MTALIKPLTDEQRRRGEAWLILRRELGGEIGRDLVTTFLADPIAFSRKHGVRLAPDDRDRLHPDYYERRYGTPAVNPINKEGVAA